MEKVVAIIKNIIESVRCIAYRSGSIFVFLYIAVMAVIFPFYLTDGYRNAGTDKSMLFRYVGMGFVLAMLVCSLIYAMCSLIYGLCSLRKAEKGNFIQRICLSDKLIFVYGLLTIVSFLCSNNKQDAFWGSEGWYMGLAAQMTFIMSYFFISRFLICKNLMLVLFVISAFVTFMWGTLNRFSVYPVAFDASSPSFIATLGNINWYCGYWSVFFPIAVGLFYISIVRENDLRWKNIMCRMGAGLYLAVSTAAGAVQGSDSAMLVFAVVTLVLYCVSARDKHHRKAFYITVMVMCAVCQTLRLIRDIFPKAMNYDSVSADILTDGNLTAILFLVLLFQVTDEKLIDKLSERYLRLERTIVMVIILAALLTLVGLITINTINPSSIGALSDNPIFTFNSKWGSSRGATWTAGIKVFADNSVIEKLIGLGPDSFDYGVYRDGSSAADMVIGIFGDSRLTNAHSEWITVLVNTGLLGLITYVGMFMTKTVRYIANGMNKNISLPIAFVCGLALVGYMSNNIFSFQQVLNGPFVYIMLGIGEAVIRESKADKREIYEDSNL